MSSCLAKECISNDYELAEELAQKVARDGPDAEAKAKIQYQKDPRYRLALIYIYLKKQSICLFFKTTKIICSFKKQTEILCFYFFASTLCLKITFYLFKAKFT